MPESLGFPFGCVLRRNALSFETLIPLFWYVKIWHAKIVDQQKTTAGPFRHDSFADYYRITPGSWVCVRPPIPVVHYEEQGHSD